MASGLDLLLAAASCDTEMNRLGSSKRNTSSANDSRDYWDLKRPLEGSGSNASVRSLPPKKRLRLSSSYCNIGSSESIACTAVSLGSLSAATSSRQRDVKFSSDVSRCSSSALANSEWSRFQTSRPSSLPASNSLGSVLLARAGLSGGVISVPSKGGGGKKKGSKSRKAVRVADGGSSAGATAASGQNMTKSSGINVHASVARKKLTDVNGNEFRMGYFSNVLQVLPAVVRRTTPSPVGSSSVEPDALSEDSSQVTESIATETDTSTTKIKPKTAAMHTQDNSQVQEQVPSQEKTTTEMKMLEARKALAEAFIDALSLPEIHPAAVEPQVSIQSPAPTSMGSPTQEAPKSETCVEEVAADHLSDEDMRRKRDEAHSNKAKLAKALLYKAYMQVLKSNGNS